MSFPLNIPLFYLIQYTEKAILIDFKSINKLAIKLTQKANLHIKKGHPWVFEKSIVKQNKEGKAGDLAIIFDEKRNSFLALGLYDPESTIRIKVLHHGKAIQFDRDFLNDKFITS